MKPLQLCKSGDYWTAREHLLELAQVLQLPIIEIRGQSAVTFPDHMRRECTTKLLLAGFLPTLTTQQ